MKIWRYEHMIWRYEDMKIWTHYTMQFEDMKIWRYEHMIWRYEDMNTLHNAICSQCTLSLTPKTSENP